MNRRNALRALMLGAPTAAIGMATAPAFAKGGYTGGYVTGERGAEMIVLPKGESVMPQTANANKSITTLGLRIDASVVDQALSRLSEQLRRDLDQAARAGIVGEHHIIPG